MPEANGRDVFVSYSTKDTVVADLVVRGLEEAGVTCWIAPRDIAEGSTWPLSIPPAITGCRCFLLVFSGNSDTSYWVMKEITIAAGERKPILPLRIEDIKPGRLALFLSDTQWVEAWMGPVEIYLGKLTAATLRLIGAGSGGLVAAAPIVATRTPVNLGLDAPPAAPKPRPMNAAERLAAAKQREEEHGALVAEAKAEFAVCQELDGHPMASRADKAAAWQDYLDRFAAAKHEIDHARARHKHWTKPRLAIRRATAQAAPPPPPRPPAAPSLSGPGTNPGDRAELSLPGGVTMAFRWCPPGSFTMGSPKHEAERSGDEGPVQVTLTRGFWMAETAVTVAQFRAFVEMTGYRTEAETGDGASRWTGSEWKRDKATNWLNPGFAQGDTHPVTCVSWNDAKAFADWAKLRLPTEAQWEYACRAGTQTPFHFGATITPELVNYNGYHPYGGAAKGLYRQQPTEVGSFPANAWGLYDMHGNVREWCADWYRPVLVGGADSMGPPLGQRRAIRGGSWASRAHFCRTASRGEGSPYARHNALGFRIALSVHQ